ncbi:UDP binding domain-containing protein [Rhodanobacter terrae]|uniref:UDP binding domain-containing protein n=1 Tax=Rhodanobacter terrae TaxID=418647 RepID=A0ABW0T3R1_9GAMM
MRNTRVVDIVQALTGYNAHVDIHDPWVDAEEAHKEYGIELLPQSVNGTYDAVILAVGHREFTSMGAGAIRALGNAESVLYDVKYVLPREAVDGRL